jgi:hypothetical protein
MYSMQIAVTQSQAVLVPLFSAMHRYKVALAITPEYTHFPLLLQSHCNLLHVPVGCHPVPISGGSQNLDQTLSCMEKRLHCEIVCGWLGGGGGGGRGTLMCIVVTLFRLSHFNCMQHGTTWMHAFAVPRTL